MWRIGMGGEVRAHLVVPRDLSSDLTCVYQGALGSPSAASSLAVYRTTFRICRATHVVSAGYNRRSRTTGTPPCEQRQHL